MGIKVIPAEIQYFDKHGNQIHENDLVRYEDGKIKKVIRTIHDELGTDATNPAWVGAGRAYEGEFGIYPFEEQETNEVEIYHCDLTPDGSCPYPYQNCDKCKPLT